MLAGRGGTEMIARIQWLRSTHKENKPDKVETYFMLMWMGTNKWSVVTSLLILSQRLICGYSPPSRLQEQISKGQSEKEKKIQPVFRIEIWWDRKDSVSCLRVFYKQPMPLGESDLTDLMGRSTVPEPWMDQVTIEPVIGVQRLEMWQGEVFENPELRLIHGTGGEYMREEWRDAREKMKWNTVLKWLLYCPRENRFVWYWQSLRNSLWEEIIHIR